MTQVTLQPTRILAVDLGTTMGFSIGDVATDELPSISGTKRLASKEELAAQRKTGKERTGDCRYARLVETIREFIAVHQIGRIIFEDVPFAGSRMQTQLWASLRTALWQIQIEMPHIEVFDVHAMTLKKWATDNGKADKAAMARALSILHPKYHASIDGRIYNEQGVEMDDNEVDSIWIYLYAHNLFKTGQDWGTTASRRAEKKQQRQQAVRLRNHLKKIKSQVTH